MLFCIKVWRKVSKIFSKVINIALDYQINKTKKFKYFSLRKINEAINFLTLT